MSGTKLQQGGQAPSRIRLRGGLGAGMVLLLLAAAVFAWQRGPASTGSREYRVVLREVEARLVERGYLESREKYPVMVKASGQILEITASGIPVEPGDRLLRVEDVDPRDAIRDRTFRIGVGTLERDILQARYALAEFEERMKIALDREKLAHAVLEEEKETQGLTPEERRLLAIEIELARLDLEDAKDELHRQQRLYERGFVTRSVVEPSERKVESASEYLSELRLKKKLKEKGVPEERRLELKMKVARARAEVDRGEKAMARRLEKVQDDLDKATAKITQDEYALSTHEEDLKNANVYAEHAGIFVIRLTRDWRSGGIWTPYRPGIDLWDWTEVADIINPASMRVEVAFNEVDFPRVREGMRVNVRLPALPDRLFEGTLAYVGGVGLDRYEVADLGQEMERTGVTMFNAIVEFDGQGQEFRPGMSALVEVLLDEPEPRLVVPREGIHMIDGEPCVYRKGANGPERAVLVGRFGSPREFIVEEGLEEGDVILLMPDANEEDTEAAG